MVDSNLITVTNNENPVIEVEISYIANEAEVKFLQSKGDKGDTGDTGPVFDWTGTSAEYSAGLANGTITNTMVCYITDDASIIDLDSFATASDLNTEISRAQAAEASLQTISHTHSNKAALDNVSGTNTGDQDLSAYATTSAVNSGLATKPTILSGTTVPLSTPSKVGDIYVDTTNYKTYVSKGTSTSSDWIKQNGSYVIQVGGTGYTASPADATTYYFGALTGSSSYATTYLNTAHRIYIPRAGTISKIYGVFVSGTAGSNETSSLYLRVNNTTDYLISSSITVNSTSGVTFNNTSLNIPVSEGDYILYKYISPTWATNPTNMSFQTSILVDF